MTPTEPEHTDKRVVDGKIEHVLYFKGATLTEYDTEIVQDKWTEAMEKAERRAKIRRTIKRWIPDLAVVAYVVMVILLFDDISWVKCVILGVAGGTIKMHTSFIIETFFPESSDKPVTDK